MKSNKFKIIVLLILAVPAFLLAVNASKECFSYYKSQQHFNTAHEYLHENLFDKAIAELDKSISAYPYYFAAYEELASVYFLKGDYDKAVKVYCSGLRYMPKNSNLHCNLSKIYFMKKDYCNALKSIQTAKELDPSCVLSREYSAVKEEHDKMKKHNCFLSPDK